MLRVALLLLYLFAYSLGQAKTGAGNDPDGLSDLSGLHLHPPPTTDSGAGNDPNG